MKDFLSMSVMSEFVKRFHSDALKDVAESNITLAIIK